MSEDTAWRAPLEGLHIPRHIAIIMDGNGRWARQRGLPRIHGHFEGRKSTKRCAGACADIGVGALSVYAFSVENWRRPAEEVQGLMALIEASLLEEIEEFHSKNVRLVASGRRCELSESLQQAILTAEESTRDNTGMVLNLLINYGGRAEVLDAARHLAREAVAGRLSPEDFTEDHLSQAMYTPWIPDPDLIIRPGGELRISNFLLWELAYSEFVVMPVLWPDFRNEHLAEAIVEFNRRERRFGGVPQGAPGPA
jgi:undecaprenyl diphosphate synthase